MMIKQQQRDKKMKTLLIQQEGSTSDDLTTITVCDEMYTEVGMSVTGEAKDSNGLTYQVSGKVIEIA